MISTKSYNRWVKLIPDKETYEEYTKNPMFYVIFTWSEGKDYEADNLNAREGRKE